MENKDIIKRTRNLIAHGKTKEAIESLMPYAENLENKELLHRLIILSSRYYEWEQKGRMNLIDDTYSNSFANRIVYDLLTLTEQLSKYKQDAKPIFELSIEGGIKDFDNEKKKNLINSLKVLLGLKENEIQIKKID